MSDIYIPGMEMPTSCAFCRFCDGLADTQVGTCAFCMVDGKYRDARTNYACPLVPVPEHGRLIDADAAVVAIQYSIKVVHDGMPKILLDYAKRVFNATPTIIPADPIKEETE